MTGISRSPRVQNIVFTFFGMLPLAALLWVGTEFPNLLQ